MSSLPIQRFTISSMNWCLVIPASGRQTYSAVVYLCICRISGKPLHGLTFISFSTILTGFLVRCSRLCRGHDVPAQLFHLLLSSRELGFQEVTLNLHEMLKIGGMKQVAGVIERCLHVLLCQRQRLLRDICCRMRDHIDRLVRRFDKLGEGFLGLFDRVFSQFFYLCRHLHLHIFAQGSSLLFETYSYNTSFELIAVLSGGSDERHRASLLDPFEIFISRSPFEAADSRTLTRILHACGAEKVRASLQLILWILENIWFNKP
jgi:hypothetical protein